MGIQWACARHKCKSVQTSYSRLVLRIMLCHYSHDSFLDRDASSLSFLHKQNAKNSGAQILDHQHATQSRHFH